MFSTLILKRLVLPTILLSLCLTGCEKKEHPTEHPADTETTPAITKDQLADAIEAYVKDTAQQHDGFFVVTDDQTGQELKLTLDKVHRQKLARVGKDRYFACADFKAPDGTIYDLDVFMTGTDKDKLTFDQFTIHKVAGKERYTWYEKEGLWLQKPVTAAQEKMEEKAPEEKMEEKPEHPAEHPKEQPEGQPEE